MRLRSLSPLADQGEGQGLGIRFEQPILHFHISGNIIIDADRDLTDRVHC
jgi:hypothetical protein